MDDLKPIRLGPKSPLHELARKARAATTPSESDIQIAAMSVLVGPARKGLPRDPQGGMIPRYPELRLLYAIPNGGVRHKATAGRMKAEGVLSSMLDLCLPVMRGPFAGLYIEVKVPGKHMRPDQRDTASWLRGEHHCVIECQSAQEIIDVVVGYLTLPRSCPGEMRLGWAETESANLAAAQDRLETRLTPRREPGGRVALRSAAGPTQDKAG